MASTISSIKSLTTIQQLVANFASRRNNKQKKQRVEDTVVFARTQTDAHLISQKANLPVHGESWFAVGDIVQDWQSGRFARIDSIHHDNTRLPTNTRYDFRSGVDVRVYLTWMDGLEDDDNDKENINFLFQRNVCDDAWLQHAMIHLVEQYTGGPAETIIALLVKSDVDAELTQCEVDFLSRVCGFLTADGVLKVEVLSRIL